MNTRSIASLLALSTAFALAVHAQLSTVSEIVLASGERATGIAFERDVAWVAPDRWR